MRERGSGERSASEARGTAAGGARGSARRRAAHALGDAALVDAMRADDDLAWGEFDDRFRPILERYARRSGIPDAEWPVCVDEVIEDEGLRFASGAPLPQQMDAYLVRAVRNRWLRVKRAAARHQSRLLAVTDAEAGARGAARTLVSERLLRVSEGADRAADEPSAHGARARLAERLFAELPDDELLLLSWVAECMPYRQIAEWLGVGYDAASKRIWRLCRKLRRRAAELARDWPPEERAAVARLIEGDGTTLPAPPPAAPPAAPPGTPRPRTR